MTRTLVIAAIALCAGCIPTATNDPVLFCEEQARIQCQFAYRCCTDVEDRAESSMTLFVSSRNEGECIDSWQALCRGWGRGQQISNERGRSKVDEEQAQECLDHKREAMESCDIGKWRDDDDKCSDIYVGLGEAGDDCIGNSECNEDANCEIERNDDGTPKKYDDELAVARGECKAKGGAGDECETEGDCKSSLVCRYDTGLCAEAVAEGGECSSSYECKEDLYCSQGSCAKKIGAGEPCPDYTGCEDGLFCEEKDGTYACVSDGADDDDDDNICKGE